MKNAGNNINNVNIILINRINTSTKMVIESKIMQILTILNISNTIKVLTLILPNKIGDVDKNTFPKGLNKKTSI